MQNSALVNVFVLIIFLVVVPPLVTALLTRFTRQRSRRLHLAPAAAPQNQPPHVAGRSRGRSALQTH